MEEIRVHNCSKQTIPLQVREPGSDFFKGEQQLRLAPGQEVPLPKAYANMDQITNLQKRGLLRITYDSERNK